MKTGLYIHVPFCREKCDYCSFYSLPVAGRGDFSRLADRYTDRVSEEIREVLGEGSYTIDTIYFGGGTPSLLPFNNLETILDTIKRVTSVEKDAELTIETNPGSASSRQLAGLRDLGFTRVTMGLQTINVEAHRKIGRQGAPCRIEELDDCFSVPGIDLCLDVIAGIPGHDFELYTGELEEIIARQPAHLSVYLLTLEEGTPLAERLSEDEEMEDMQAAAFLKTREILQGAGYRHYEISNYAREGKESRHNQKYWRYLPYAGFGPGAHSFLGDRRWYNEDNLEVYLEKGPFQWREDVRSREQAMVEYLMTGLRLLEGINTGDFEARLGEPVPSRVMKRVDELAAEELLAFTSPPDKKGEQLALTERGLITSDSVIYRLVEPLLE